MPVTPEALESALAALVERRPGSAVDDRVRARLSEVLADPDGQTWMEAAGLLEGDSCGYPVEGGYYDTKSELAAAPGTDDAIRARALEHLTRDWADDYALTGRARLDRSWREALVDAAPQG